MNSFKYGCAARRNKGTCNNRALSRRDEVEARVLGGLKDQLLHPDLIAEFIAEYQREYNRLMHSERADRTRLEKELSQVTGQIDRIVDAVANGMFHESMRDKLTDLEERKAALAAQLAELGDEEPVQLHPRLAERYRAKVADLSEALNDPETRVEAAEAMRGLLTEIRLIPVAGGHEIELLGDLAGILALTQGQTKTPPAPGAGVSVPLVAGGRLGLYLPIAASRVSLS